MGEGAEDWGLGAREERKKTKTVKKARRNSEPLINQ
jgi:hypothetical protein